MQSLKPVAFMVSKTISTIKVFNRGINSPTQIMNCRESHIFKQDSNYPSLSAL